MEFINESLINSFIEDLSLQSRQLQKEILAKSVEAKGLSVRESAALLNIDEPELLERLYESAKEVKNKIYGNRVAIFAPLHTSNRCAYNCPYCGFRAGNSDLKIKRLSLDEIRAGAESILNEGHKRILLVCGDEPNKIEIEFVAAAIETILDVKDKNGGFRRLDLSSAPLSVDNFRALKKAGVALYHSFIESYHYPTYTKIYPANSTKKFVWQLYSVERAFQAGIEDVGIGTLAGLTDYKFEILALLSHAIDIDHKFGIGPNTISLPRLAPAIDAPLSHKPPFAVDDEKFKKIIAVIRLALPYTGISISTRESAWMRDELLEVGGTEISAAAGTMPFNFKESQDSLEEYEMEQFTAGDSRKLGELVRDFCQLGILPSFCTACAGTERTGNKFLEMAKAGLISKFCIPNGLISLKEFMSDYAPAEIKEVFVLFLEKELTKLDLPLQVETQKILAKIESGERGIFI